MKTLIKSLALALSLGVVTTAATLANTNPGGHPTTVASYKSSVYTTANGKVNIALDKQTGGSVDVRLKNAAGTAVFTQHLNKNDSKYRTRLNLDELPDGDYQVEITNGVDTTTHAVKISTQQPETTSRLIAIN